MSLATVDARTVLASLTDDPLFQRCFLANSNKQLYQLDVLSIDPNALRVILKAPNGRLNPIDPEQPWDLTFRDRQGAYQAPVKKIVVEGGQLIFFLENYLCFLARRKSIRLPVDSRNPIEVFFDYRDERYRALLIDFSLTGIGLQIPEDLNLTVGKKITRGMFELRSHQIGFTAALIVHVHYTERGSRIGFQFLNLSPLEAEIIQRAFHDWHMSQKPPFSWDKEG